VCLIMKTKLTLTVNSEVIKKARKHSEVIGKSISQLFEEFIKNTADKDQKSESQLAAERLLKKISASKSVKTLDDKALLKKRVSHKYG
jgi:hypothetical protein